MSYEYQMRVYQYPNGDSLDWVVEYPDLPGCIGTGDTIEEAIEDAKFGKDMWIEAATKIGKEIPTPSNSYSIEYSGKFNIRIPKSLHRDLVLKAEEEDVSLNALCSTLLARGVYNQSSSADNHSTGSKIYTEAPKTFIAQEKWDESTKKINEFSKIAV